MRIFCISDPHYGRDMSRFGDIWIAHEKKIRENWLKTVTADDIVLIPGDFSWATTNKSLEKHLDEVDSLPGRKILTPGNHDKWWKKADRFSCKTIHLMNDAHMPFGPNWTVAASMGWEQPESPWWNESMRPEFEAACRNLESTLEAAHRSRPNSKILLMIHYPPRWNRNDPPSAFEEIIARYPVDLLVYGHIHGVDLPRAFNEEMSIYAHRLRYENASVDRTLMKPILVLEDPTVILPLPS